MNPAIQQLVDYIKSVSPYLWSVAYRQVFVDSITGILWAGILSAGGFYCWKLSGRFDLDDGAPKVFFIAGAVVFLFIASIFLMCNLEQLANPGYYAIRYLTELMPGTK